MKAYLTTIGERTTDICAEQLKRFGFDVQILDGAMPWAQKYKQFIETADEDCLRIDADVIINKNINILIAALESKTGYVIQGFTYDFYRNNIGVTTPILYSKTALALIRQSWDKIGLLRPEANACRLPGLSGRIYTSPAIVGMHGFFQDVEHLKMAQENKVQRGQIAEYDFELANKLLSL